MEFGTVGSLEWFRRPNVTLAAADRRYDMMCVPKEGGSGGIYGTARPRGRGE